MQSSIPSSSVLKLTGTPSSLRHGSDCSCLSADQCLKTFSSFRLAAQAWHQLGVNMSIQQSTIDARCCQ